MSCDYLLSVPVRRIPHRVEEYPILNLLGSAISSLFAFVLSLPFLLGFLLILPACLSVRWLLLFMHYNRQGSNSASEPEIIRGNDNRWLGTEWRSSVIHAVLVFEAKEGVNIDHFRRLLLRRVIPVYPRLTQRLILLSAGVGNCWLRDPKFSINNHVFLGPSFLTNEKDLQLYVSKLIENGLPEDKPPWQMQVFYAIGVNQDTVAILRIHQSVADGTTLMRLLCHSLADPQVIEIPERPRFGSFSFCMNVIRACFIGPLTVLFWLFLSSEDCNLLTHRSAWTGSVTVTWSATITLHKVTRIKQVTRSTVNCVLLSALAGALRRLLQGCDVKQPQDVKVVVPMDLRNQTSTTRIRTRLGNKTSSAVLTLPVAVEGCVPRLWATRKILESLKTSADPVILYVTTAALMSIGSASFARHLINFLTNKASVQFSSLPGPTSEIFLEGQTLKGIYPILPTQANLGISITTLTYADQVFVSVTAEQALGPAAELILEYLEDQIEVLWKLLLNRRVPGESEAFTVFTKTIVTESPVKEITSRLSLVQKEVQRLSEGKENDKDGKLSVLRTEFFELVDELKKRQSLCEGDDSNTYSKPEPKAFSVSNSAKQSNITPKIFKHQFHSSEVSPREPDIIQEENKKIHLTTQQCDSTNVSKKFQLKSGTSNSKDCFVILLENKKTSKTSAAHSLNFNKPSETLELNPKDQFKKPNCKQPNLEISKEKQILGICVTENAREKTKAQISSSNSETDAMPHSGPYDLFCDLTYKNYLEATILKDKQLTPESSFKCEDFDEPEIAGGVLI